MKKIMSLSLVFIIVFYCSVTAFAVSNQSESIDDFYTYYGELTEGSTTVWYYDSIDDDVYDLYVYYTFNASADGYYLFRYGTPHTAMWAAISDPDNSGEEPYYEETLFEHYSTTKIYYLSKGEYSFIVDIYSSAVGVDVYSEFLGEEITDISFNYDQLLDYDLSWYEFEDDYYFESYADATITFSSGKEYYFSGGVLAGTSDSKPVNGKNDVKINFLDKGIASSVTVYPVSHFVSDVELSNADYYLKNVTEYYNDYKAIYPYGEAITISFTDGTTQSVEFSTYNSYITLSNGQDYQIEVYYDTDYDLFSKRTYKMEICLGYYCVIKEYEVNCTKANFIENIKWLKEYNSISLDYIREDIRFMIQSAGDKEEFMYWLGNVVLEFFEMNINFFDFFWYYVTFSFVR